MEGHSIEHITTFSGSQVLAPTRRGHVHAGMRVRLTRNLDKDRGFVNGAIGTVISMLSECNFVLRTDRGILLLVHPIYQDGIEFMPCAYGYAMTIRKSQGSTQGLVPYGLSTQSFFKCSSVEFF